MSVSKKATTTADFSLAFGSIEQQYGNINLFDFLPERLAEICTKDADANCFPIAGILSTVLTDAILYSPSTYVSTPGSNMTQPLIVNQGNIALSGTNKTGCCGRIVSIQSQVNDALFSIGSSNNGSICCISRNVKYRYHRHKRH